MNIAYEISPLLAASGHFGDKSGVYRITYNLILHMSKYLAKKFPRDNIYLFTINPALLASPQPDLYTLFLKKNVHLVKYPSQYQYTLADLPSEEKLFFNFINRRYIKIKEALGRKKYYNKLLNTLSWHLKRQNVEIVHLSETGYLPVPGFINVMTINDLVPFLFPHWQRPETILIHQRKIKAALTKCKGVVCISKNTKKDLLDISINHPSEAKVKVIYPGSEVFHTRTVIDFDQLNRVVTHNGYAALHKGEYLLNYGTIEPRKNISTILYSFFELLTLPQCKHLKLVLMGGDGWGEIKQKIVHLIKERYPIKKDSPIIMLDFLDDSYLTALIKNSKAVLYPSLYEGFGMPIVEAFQYGIPVITSQVSSMPEVGGDGCLYVDPYSPEDLTKAMKELVVNQDTHLRLSKHTKAQVEKFTWDKSVVSHYEFYQELLAS